ncbi:MAG: glycosyl hydrolase-related protein [Thermomicrobiales bacterium]
MQPIKTLYLVNHSHTDVGFTDYQDLCFRQHCEFIDQALDLIEATKDFPAEAQYRWVCEVTGMTETYFEKASSAQVERFKKWHDLGFIDVAGMQYNHTPMQIPEQMIRSLYPVRRLRDKFGLKISTAMQCDVNGVSWLYADLLPQIGVELMTMAVNPLRGYTPKPIPNGFWWEGPSGGKVLAWNGFHYLWGRSIAKLGDWRFVDESLPPIVARLEADPDYPFDFMYAQSTHPIRVDNGPPDSRMPAFVREWNERGRTPRIEFTTPARFNHMLREHYADNFETLRGDWLDWWSDGVASSAFETGVSRATHDQLLTAENISAWLKSEGISVWSTERATHAYEQSTLFDEHTWGAFASIAAPKSLWARGQWNRKANFAYTASAEALDMLAEASRRLARTVAEPGIEGMFNLGDLDPRAAYPETGADSLLVVNTLPWARHVVVVESEQRGWAAPAGVPEDLFPRNVPWGGFRPETPYRRVAGEVPGYGYAFLPLASQPTEDDLAVGPATIENAHYRVRIDPETGSIAEWYDKALDHDFAGEYQGWGIGQYVYERVESSEDRQALFWGDFSAEDFGYGRTDTPWQRWTVENVTVNDAIIAHGKVSISVDVKGPGIVRGQCVYALESGQKSLAVDWTLDKEHQTGIEAVFIAFPFNFGTPSFRADINGIPFSPNKDQLNGTVRDWYPLGRWVDVSDGERGVTMTPLDAPLVHLGGITTGKWARELEPDGPTIMSWALQNHWMVNFKASQGGEIPLRYRLTTHAGAVDDVAATKFGLESTTPPVSMRDYLRTGPESGRFLDIPEDAPVVLTAKPADDNDGIIVRLQNLTPQSQSVPVRFEAAAPKSADLTSALEINGDALPVEGASITVPVDGLAIQTFRVRF